MRISMKKISAIFFFLVTGMLFSRAQDVKVTASFDSAKIVIGDQINFTVSVEKPAGLGLILPVFRDTIQRNIEIVKGPVTDSTVMPGGRVKINRRYLITSFDSGFYQVPPVYAELQESNGLKRFYSDYAPLAVTRAHIAPPSTKDKIYDIVQPYKAPLTAGEILTWVFIVLVAAAAVWYGYRIFRKIRAGKDEIQAPEAPPEPAHIIALRDLEKLKEEQLWQNGKIKLYYTRLSEILRQYLENRYRIQSLELTTPETLTLLKKSGFREDELYQKLKSVLTGADLVKFAKYNPQATENDDHYERAWDFISLTRLVEQEAEIETVNTETGEGS